MNKDQQYNETGYWVESTGPWPFITRHVLNHQDGKRTVLRSRSHRKHLIERKIDAANKLLTIVLRGLWMPGHLNWWIGSLFASGAFLFALGSVFVLVPEWSRFFGLNESEVNVVFFAGSIPFTLAAYLQLYQSANSGEFSPHGNTAPKRRQFLGWKPHSAGWISCALQFMGTILFNFNTFDEILPELTRVQQDLLIWVPNITGSVLFLASGYLAFIETCHAHWSWKPGNLSWWVTFINLAGCAAFLISALFAFVPSQDPGFDVATVSVIFTLMGALAFFTGSLLMLCEAAMMGDPLRQGENR